ncbi:MAG: pyridoxal-phosphate dependent enzyme [Bacteroidales bacterium]|nr:pyridoxal-phosphate dependent enzyme [Bacteroidales bacterium]
MKTKEATLQNLPNSKDIHRALITIIEAIHRTPVMTSTLIDSELNVSLYFKCENFQKTGAFKFRGALNALMHLPSDAALHGVGTHSSGNHAAALAKAAAIFGLPAHIVMPETSREIKIKAVKHYGGEITFCKPTLKDREGTMQEVIKKTGCTFIHPYNHFDIIAGQGTAALELLEEVPDLDIIMAPVGGGGLLSGTAIYAKGLSRDIKVWGGEPAKANDAWASLKAGKLIPSDNPDTMADGLLTSLGNLTFEAISKNVDRILLCDEENIVKAMRLIWEKMKIIIEPSSAVPLGALLQNPGEWEHRKVGIILSGGNVDLTNLPFMD